MCMKKFVLFLLSLILLVSCSSDESMDVPQKGTYIYSDETLSVSVGLDYSDGKTTVAISIQPNNETPDLASGQFFSVTETTDVVGEYPNYYYEFEGVIFTVIFDAPTSFTAMYHGTLDIGIKLPRTMYFTHTGKAQ